ncbi:hypothetical protein TREMEDRAFT_66451 [Tremella mesenterica DSM 1558]|uniref:uncharacterized protein n=1 Tax=Tremella mesenterica (strain ATCC 24925 / CBS 8224 / DSM 1558 / NBRC 9311 / NRRL Y-6157 / RJB 2259-6 / UBC 559-6) TaxID=578456 RepID=UPI00032C3DAE|nr:uncharacterized protein TREMEDRAFT_66451 [Tremella mesenterica DSM 1558]EIW65539.1 hypothetical protein TREMEDRAFT_66451 [Tremella mesenterica DSM 1558]
MLFLFLVIMIFLPQRYCIESSTFIPVSVWYLKLAESNGRLIMDRPKVPKNVVYSEWQDEQSRLQGEIVIEKMKQYNLDVSKSTKSGFHKWWKERYGTLIPIRIEYFTRKYGPLFEREVPFWSSQAIVYNNSNRRQVAERRRDPIRPKTLTLPWSSRLSSSSGLGRSHDRVSSLDTGYSASSALDTSRASRERIYSIPGGSERRDQRERSDHASSPISVIATTTTQGMSDQTRLTHVENDSDSGPGRSFIMTQDTDKRSSPGVMLASLKKRKRDKDVDVAHPIPHSEPETRTRRKISSSLYMSNIRLEERDFNFRRLIEIEQETNTVNPLDMLALVAMDKPPSLPLPLPPHPHPIRPISQLRLTRPTNQIRIEYRGSLIWTSDWKLMLPNAIRARSTWNLFQVDVSLHRLFPYHLSSSPSRPSHNLAPHTVHPSSVETTHPPTSTSTSTPTPTPTSPSPATMQPPHAHRSTEENSPGRLVDRLEERGPMLDFTAVRRILTPDHDTGKGTDPDFERKIHQLKVMAAWLKVVIRRPWRKRSKSMKTQQEPIVVGVLVGEKGPRYILPPNFKQSRLQDGIIYLAVCPFVYEEETNVNARLSSRLVTGWTEDEHEERRDQSEISWIVTVVRRISKDGYSLGRRMDESLRQRRIGEDDSERDCKKCSRYEMNKLFLSMGSSENDFISTMFDPDFSSTRICKVNNGNRRIDQIVKDMKRTMNQVENLDEMLLGKDQEEDDRPSSGEQHKHVDFDDDPHVRLPMFIHESGTRTRLDLDPLIKACLVVEHALLSCSRDDTELAGCKEGLRVDDTDTDTVDLGDLGGDPSAELWARLIVLILELRFEFQNEDREGGKSGGDESESDSGDDI